MATSAILVSDKLSDELWDKAITVAPEKPVLDQQFFREEWQRVIQPNGVADRESYLKVSRAGRGVKLNRKERDAIWCVFEEYRQLLNERGLKEFEDATRDARHLLERQADVLLYKAVLLAMRPRTWDRSRLNYTIANSRRRWRRGSDIYRGRCSSAHLRPAVESVSLRNKHSWPWPKAANKLPDNRGDKALGCGAAQ